MGKKAKLLKGRNEDGRDKLPFMINTITKEHKLFTRGLSIPHEIHYDAKS